MWKLLGVALVLCLTVHAQEEAYFWDEDTTGWSLPVTDETVTELSLDDVIFPDGYESVVVSLQQFQVSIFQHNNFNNIRLAKRLMLFMFTPQGTGYLFYTIVAAQGCILQHGNATSYRGQSALATSSLMFGYSPV